MPKSLFTPTPRERLKIGEVFRHATCTACDEAEEQFLIGNCRITCRFRTEPGDFVSRQVLGCHNAVRTGRLYCADRELTLERIARTQAVIGMVGPDNEVDDVASALAARFAGVLVSATDAVGVGDG
jgi:hypothetical protein